MNRMLLDSFICCPVDRSYPLSVEEGSWAGDELISGVLRCTTCGNTYPVEDGIPNLLPGGVQADEMVAAKQREAQARDEDAPIYDSTVPDYHTHVEMAAMVKALRIEKGDVVLDLGAGTGRLTVEMAKRGATVLAMDISPRSLAINRDKCAGIAGADVHYMLVDACYLPLRDGVASKAGSGMMIEHIPTAEERRRCLLEINRVLRPQGRLALTAYNYSWSKRRLRKQEGYHGTDLYYYYFKREEVRQLLSEYKVRTLTALLNLPGRLESQQLDRVIMAIPPLAGFTGELIFAVAERKGNR